MNYIIKNTNAKGNNDTIKIRVRDYFPKDSSGIEYLDISTAAYQDLCEYKRLLAGCEKKSIPGTVIIKIRDLYPHLCKDERKKICIDGQLYTQQLEHTINRETVLIRISDFYPGNRCEDKFMEITESMLRTLELYRKKDKNEKERLEDNTDGYGFDENTRGEIDGIYAPVSSREYEIEQAIRELFAPYGAIILRRAIMYFVKCYTINQIAEVDGVSNEAARKSVRKLEEIVHNAGAEYFGY